ncbi:MAG: hypothetical protein AB1640_03105 [bacterium]
MATCGLCGIDVDQDPHITSEGDCSECGVELAMQAEELEEIEEEEEEP